MGFDPIANGWRKLIEKETKTTPITIEWDMMANYLCNRVEKRGVS